MKVALTLGLLVVLGVLLWKRRRRVGLALRVGIGLYALVMLSRLLQMREDSDQLITLGMGVGLLLVIWLLGRALVALLDRRRERKRQEVEEGTDARSASSASAER